MAAPAAEQPADEVAETEAAASDPVADEPAPTIEAKTEPYASLNDEEATAAHSSAGMIRSIQAKGQLEYEACLVDEIMKLRESIRTNDVVESSIKTQQEEDNKEVQQRKLVAVEQAGRVADLESALLAAQVAEQAKVAKRRADADARLAEREAELQRQRAIEIQKREEARLLQEQTHRETVERAARERDEEAHMKQVREAAKAKALRERLEAEQREMAARNAEKARQSAAKVVRAAQQRQQMTMEARRDFKLKHEAHERREAALRREHEVKVEEQRQAAAQKKAEMARVQAERQAQEAERIEAIKRQEARKEESMLRRGAEMREQRRLRQHERQLAMAASRVRVEGAMNTLQARLDSIEQQSDARDEKARYFLRAKNARIEQQQRIGRSYTMHKHALTNSMYKIQGNLQQSTLRFTVPKDIRHNFVRPELREIFDRCDPSGEGVVTLGSVRAVLEEMRIVPSPNAPHRARYANLRQSSSLPNLVRQSVSAGPSYGRADFPPPPPPAPAPAASPPAAAPKVPGVNDGSMSALEAAFRRADADGNGEISKRELYVVIDEAGLKPESQQSLIRIFKGFDVNDDGKLSLEEFKALAKAIVRK